MADPLTEEIRDALATAAVEAQERLSLRGHALYCAAMTYAENGYRARTPDVLSRADEFLAWLYEGSPRAALSGGTPEPTDG